MKIHAKQGLWISEYGKGLPRSYFLCGCHVWTQNWEKELGQRKQVENLATYCCVFQSMINAQENRNKTSIQGAKWGSWHPSWNSWWVTRGKYCCLPSVKLVLSVQRELRCQGATWATEKLTEAVAVHHEWLTGDLTMNIPDPGTPLCWVIQQQCIIMGQAHLSIYLLIDCYFTTLCSRCTSYLHFADEETEVYKMKQHVHGRTECDRVGIWTLAVWF